MKTVRDDMIDRFDLRARAVEHLKGPNSRVMAGADASAALGVLYDLASSPSTAADALALLHELQVHQVEVDLQDEELRRSRVELETVLTRQEQLYDDAPVGLLTVDFNGIIHELNRTAAALLGVEREFLRGRSLEAFLTPDSALTLRGLLGRPAPSAITETTDLQLRRNLAGSTRTLHASARRDPAGGGVLIAVMSAMGNGEPVEHAKFVDRP